MAITSNSIGENFCDAVQVIVDSSLKNLAYDYTQVCEIIDISKRDNGIYRVQIGQSKFQAYSSVTTYELGDSVYVVTPNNDVSQQRIILAKKQTSVQEPITYVKPFNNFIKLTNNLVDPIYEKKLIANNKNESEILIWSSSRNTVYAGYTRLGLTGLFQSSIPEAISGTYGLEIRIYNGENSELIKTFTLSSADMYGNPYNFNGYYTQQKLFDISDISAFDKIEIYFYQDNDFEDLTNEKIPYKDNIGQLLAPNLFVSNPEIYLGYDATEQFNEGIILYTPNSIYYGKTQEKKEIKWRFIKTYNDNTYKMIANFDELPYGYKVNFYQYNAAAKFDSIAGVNWEKISTNTDIEPFIPDQTVTNYKYKAVIVYNNKPIYESNVLEFTNVLDVVGEKINKYSNNFHIEVDDKNLLGEYYVYENGILSINNNKNDAYPAFRNDKNEIEYINKIEQIKWVVPKNKTMINLVLPSKPEDILSITDDLGNQSLEEYLNNLNTIKREDIHYVEYGDNYYVYFYTPKDKNDQKISYTLKSELDTNFTNNTIKCYVTHKDYNIEAERKFSFGNSNMSPNPYRIELTFADPKIKGFYAGETQNKEIVANVYDTYGEKVKIKDNIQIKWDWYKPDSDSEGQYTILFKLEDVFDEQNKKVLNKINIVPIGSLIVQSHHSIVFAKLLVDEKEAAKAYFPIPLYKDENVVVENIVTEIQSGGNYNNIINGEYYNDNQNPEELIVSMSSSHGSDDLYMPQIVNGVLEDIPIFIENLDALYSYDFLGNEGPLASIPALRIQIPKKQNGELPIELPVEKPEIEQQTYSLKRNITNENELYYPYKIIKSDLSSGKLTKINEKSCYNGIVVGQIKKKKDELSDYEEPKYGIYGFKENEMTFSIDEKGDAFFKGKVEAGSGSIGNWKVDEKGSLSGGTTIENEDGETTIKEIILDPDNASITLGTLILSPDTITFTQDNKEVNLDQAVINSLTQNVGNVTIKVETLDKDIKNLEENYTDLKEEDAKFSTAIIRLDEDIQSVKTSLKLNDENVDGRWNQIKYIPSDAKPIIIKDSEGNDIQVVPWNALKSVNVFISGNII